MGRRSGHTRFWKFGDCGLVGAGATAMSVAQGRTTVSEAAAMDWHGWGTSLTTFAGLPTIGLTHPTRQVCPSGHPSSAA